MQVIKKIRTLIALLWKCSQEGVVEKRQVAEKHAVTPLSWNHTHLFFF